MRCKSILRLGHCGDDTAATLLRDALVSHLCGQIEGSHCHFSIKNRYFTASVSLEDLTPQESTISSEQGEKEDGILLVFHSSSNSASLSSFNAMEPIHDMAEENGQCGDLLRLCIGVTMSPPSLDGGKEYEEEFSRRVLWCLDRGYEYVEADLSDEGVKRGHNEREKDGFARVVEALIGTMWSSAEMNTEKSVQLMESYEKDAGEILPGSDDCQKANLESDVILSKNKEVISELAVPAGKENRSENEDETNTIFDEKNELRQCNFTCQDNENQNQEALFGNLEQLLKEAGRIREASKSGQLSDEERKHRAGDAAMTLMGLLNKMGFDDEEEDVCDSSDDERN